LILSYKNEYKKTLQNREGFCLILVFNIN